MADSAVSSIENAESSSQSGVRRSLHMMGWISFALFCLILFTILKLPEVKIKNWIQGTVAQMLAPHGIALTAEKTSLSLGLGVNYKLQNAVFTFPQGGQIQLEGVEVSPLLTHLLAGKIGATLDMAHGEGRMGARFSVPASLAGSPSTPIDAQVLVENLNLGRIGLLQALAGVKGSAIAKGEASIDGDSNQPSTLNGKFDLTLTKISIEPQSIMGFQIPKITISDGVIKGDIKSGKVIFSTVKLGKPGSAADDIIASMTGDIQLGKTADATQLALKTKFSLSQNVLKSFVLLDALLVGGKQPDGSYAFAFNGPAFGALPTPLPPGQ